MTAEILILALLFLFAVNAPIAVAIGTASLLAILIQGDFSMMMVIQRMFGGTDSFHLMAVPLFMYAGVIMEEGGISRRIIDFANALVGWLPGGLAAVTIVSAMFFAGISGSAAADAAAVGAILIPAMKKSGYESDFAAAVLASGGSIGVIIPPSIPMIIFGFLTGASIGQLFAAGILPGILIGVSLIGVATFISRKKGYAATAHFSLAEVWRTFRGRCWLSAPRSSSWAGSCSACLRPRNRPPWPWCTPFSSAWWSTARSSPRDLLRLFRDGCRHAGDRDVHHRHRLGLQLDRRHRGYPGRMAGSLLSLTTEPGPAAAADQRGAA